MPSRNNTTWTREQRERLKQLQSGDARQLTKSDPSNHPPVSVETCAEWRRTLAAGDQSASDLARDHIPATVRKHARGECWHHVEETAVESTPGGSEWNRVEGNDA